MASAEEINDRHQKLKIKINNVYINYIEEKWAIAGYGVPWCDGLALVFQLSLDKYILNVNFKFIVAVMPAYNINTHLHMYICIPCACRITSQRTYIMYYSGLRHCWHWVRSRYPVVQCQWRLGRGWSCYHKRELLLMRHRRIVTSCWSNVLIYRYASNSCRYVRIYIHTYSTYMYIVLALQTPISAFNYSLIYLCMYLCVSILMQCMNLISYIWIFIFMAIVLF